MARAKGTTAAHMRSFVLARHDEQTWERVLEALPPDDAKVIRSLIAVGSYEMAQQHRLMRAVDKVCGRGDLSLVREIARYEAEQDLTVVHRLFLRLANPAYILEKAGDYWGRFYDTGKWEVERPASNAASGALRELGAVDEVFCRFLTAYIQRMFELVGAKQVVCEHPRCRLAGDDACVFAGHWK